MSSQAQFSLRLDGPAVSGAAELSPTIAGARFSQPDVTSKSTTIGIVCAGCECVSENILIFHQIKRRRLLHSPHFASIGNVFPATVNKARPLFPALIRLFQAEVC